MPHPKHATISTSGSVVICCPDNDREPCPHDPARRCASCPGGAQAAPAAVADTALLPEDLVRFTLRDLKDARARLDGFLSIGNEIERAAKYDRWIAALESYAQRYEAAAPAAAQPVAGLSDCTVADFREGQWWLKELDAMVEDGTPDQKRAVAVVRNLLRTSHAAVQPVADHACAPTSVVDHEAPNVSDKAAPLARMHPDGRVIPESTYAQAAADGGASWTSVKGYTIKLGPISTPPALVGLSESQVVAALVESGCIGTVRMSYDSGPYEITRTSINADRFAKAIQRAMAAANGMTLKEPNA